MKSIEYSIRYIILIIVSYYLLFKKIYTLSFFALAIIPVNFLAIKYGIYQKLNKDNYVTKDYILFSLIVYTTILSIIFLLLNKVNFIVIAIHVIVNVLELVYTDTLRNKTSIKK